MPYLGVALTVAGLIRALESNPALCEVTGLYPAAIPIEATYSRFVAKLARHDELVQQVMRNGVAQLREQLPEFGKVVAVDSTDIRAYSTTMHPSDPDATWSRKNKQGVTYWWFGYKAHLVNCALTELPVHIEITPANVSDYKSLAPPLRNAGVQPTHVLADAGYDSLANHQFVYDELGALPIIQINKRGKGQSKMGQSRHRGKEQLRWHSIRDYPGMTRDSAQWRSLIAKRVSSERIFSRMKKFRRLGSVHHRGLGKVSLHVYLSTLTVVASTLSAIYSDTPLRKVA